MEFNDLIVLQRTNIKPSDYLNAVEKEYGRLKKFLPGEIKNVLDIGCGMGGIDIFIYRDHKPKIVFLDRDGVDEKIEYGYRETASKYNLLSETKKFVERHGVCGAQYINIDQEPFPAEEFDLTISLLAMGYHFPFDTYQPNTKLLIADIRDDLPLPDNCQIIDKGKNYQRILLTNKREKFIIRNDDVAFDTRLEEIRRFCEICDTYGYRILHAITPMGEPRKITSKRMANEQIKAMSSRLFGENKEVVEYLKKRRDLIGIHGLYHTHKPGEEEIKTAKAMVEGLGFHPTYFVPPFNEGSYPEEIVGLKTCRLSMKNGERLEDFLDAGVPKAEIMYLHSWRFDNDWHTFDALEQCLRRLA